MTTFTGPIITVGVTMVTMVIIHLGVIAGGITAFTIPGITAGTVPGTALGDGITIITAIIPLTITTPRTQSGDIHPILRRPENR